MRLDGDVDKDLEFALVGEGAEVYTGQEGLDRETFDSASEVTYDDVGGLRREVQLLREFVELPLRFPSVFKQMGISTPRGVLLHGASGVGKTLLAKAVATECGANFLVVNGPEIMSRMAGETEANLRRVFEEAANLSPCLLFIDEIDSIAAKREKAQGELEKRLVAQLLTLMDGIGANKNVVVLAATNRPNQLDPALRRFGRFDREIEVPVPDAAGRLEILKKKTQRMRLAANVDLQRLAADAHGFVGADLEQLCLEAALLCLRQQLQHIDFDKDAVDPQVLQRLEVGQQHFVAALAAVNPSALRERHVEVPNVRWGDIGGLEEVKRELKET
ncbi:cell division protein 48, putative, partial [Eimeria tenella]